MNSRRGRDGDKWIDEKGIADEMYQTTASVLYIMGVD